MNQKILFLMLTLGLILTSCVPIKDLVYLQNKNQADTTAVQSVSMKPYRLQINDIISISISANDPKLVQIFSTSNQQSETYRNESSLYFEGYTVNDHGNIRMPVLEEINVVGYTLDEVRLMIEKRLLEEYFNKEARIFVKVKLSGLRYTVNGEIVSPGTKLLFQEKLTILEAIANAGDITVVGDRKNVTILRQTPAGTEIHTIDLTDAKAMQSPYYYVQSNDYIYIKPLKQKSWGTGKTGIESLTTVFTMLTLVATTILLLRN
ncbi:sugar transporter [Flavobacterium sp. CYK-4]|uniref:polysaccharide biosynthesis/export family protein n=1 Tax=Flavobacterium lotistagni TaxID=2709660 RepID=UPI001408D0BE|nr:polysaccharide biosynthesis/export family protein [Flavobacterium lotistagni]NHM06471.1 sugar transporter [Flavobacterium lotistagni]